MDPARTLSDTLQECFPRWCRPAIACNRPVGLLSEPAQGTSQHAVRTQRPADRNWSCAALGARAARSPLRRPLWTLRKKTPTRQSNRKEKLLQQDVPAGAPSETFSPLCFQSPPISHPTVGISEASFVLWFERARFPLQTTIAPPPKP